MSVSNDPVHLFNQRLLPSGRTVADRHLNLFYSYSMGRASDLGRLQKLEDNVTRAMIVVLRSLTRETQKAILASLTRGELPELDLKDPHFDLQSLGDSRAKNATTRVLVTVSRAPTPGVMELLRAEEHRTDQVGDTRYPTEQLLKDLYGHWRSCKITGRERAFVRDEISVDFHQTCSLVELLKGSRPDAWIYAGSTALLIEAKVGGNRQFAPQLARHVRNAGWRSEGLRYVDLTWDQVARVFASAVSGQSSLDQFLLSQFIEYLVLMGETMSFENAMSGADWAISDRRDQLRLIIDRLSADGVLNRARIEPNRRPLKEAWQALGSDPHVHFTVYVGKADVGIDLTLRGNVLSGLVESDEKWGAFRELMWKTHLSVGWASDREIGPDANVSHRVLVDAMEYHIFDWYKGLQSGGESREEMRMTLSMQWINRRFRDEGSVHRFLDGPLRDLFRYSSQVGLRYAVPFPSSREMQRRLNAGKPIGRYLADRESLTDATVLCDALSAFITRLLPVYEYVLRMPDSVPVTLEDNDEGVAERFGSID